MNSAYYDQNTPLNYSNQLGSHITNNLNQNMYNNNNQASSLMPTSPRGMNYMNYGMNSLNNNNINYQVNKNTNSNIDDYSNSISRLLSTQKIEPYNDRDFLCKTFNFRVPFIQAYLSLAH